MQVREVNADEPVQLVEHQLQHRQLFVEQVRQLEPLDRLSHHCERHLLSVAQGQEQVSGHEVHALAVVQLRIEQRIRPQDARQVLVGQDLHLVEASHDVNLDGVDHVLRQLESSLGAEVSILCLNGLQIDLEHLQPNIPSLPFNILEICPQQRLLEHLIPQYLIQVPIQTTKILQALISSNKLNCESKNCCHI